MGFLAVEEEGLDVRDLHGQELVHEVLDLLAVALVGAGLRFPVVVAQVVSQHLVVDQIGSAVALPGQPVDPGLEVAPVVLDGIRRVTANLFL